MNKRQRKKALKKIPFPSSNIRGEITVYIDGEKLGVYEGNYEVEQ